MNSIKDAHELQKKNSRDGQGPGRKGLWRSTTDPWRYRCVTMITKKSTTVQAQRSEHTGPWESELPNKWYDECQVACRDKHTCIDKFESKSMY